MKKINVFLIAMVFVFSFVIQVFAADYWTFHKNDEFKNKVKYEMQVAAIAIMAEAADTANHAERVVYAKKILDGSASIEEFAIGVLTNASVKAKVTADQDYTSDLAFTVSSLFNAFAGVSL